MSDNDPTNKKNELHSSIYQSNEDNKDIVADPFEAKVSNNASDNDTSQPTISDEIPVVPLAASVIRPVDLPIALPVAEALPIRRVAVDKKTEKVSGDFLTNKNKIKDAEPRPKVFIALFIMFLFFLAAAMALSVLIYALYMGFQNLKPEIKKKSRADVQIIVTNQITV